MAVWITRSDFYGRNKINKFMLAHLQKLLRYILCNFLRVLVWALLINVPAANAAPVTVASINLCADQLVLLLADDEQILSLSNLSHRSAGSYYYK